VHVLTFVSPVSHVPYIGSSSSRGGGWWVCCTLVDCSAGKLGPGRFSSASPHWSSHATATAYCQWIEPSGRLTSSRTRCAGSCSPAVLHACMHSSSNHSGVSVASALMVWLLYCATVQAFLAWHRRSFVRFFQRECHECDICNVLLLFFPIVTLQLGRKRHSTNTGHYVLEIATSSWKHGRRGTCVQ
jgi:hypothetical protein